MRRNNWSGALATLSRASGWFRGARAKARGMSQAEAAVAFGMTPAFVGFVVTPLEESERPMASAFFQRRKNRLIQWYCASASQDRASAQGSGSGSF